jgi:2-keto-4-pentenoate hydratase
MKMKSFNGGAGFAAEAEPKFSKMESALAAATQLTKAAITSDAIKTTAEVLLRDEIVASRLKGDARGFTRWVSNNQSFYKYKLGLKVAELSGVNASVQAADKQLASGGLGWRPNGHNTVISPSNIVVSMARALRLGCPADLCKGPVS